MTATVISIVDRLPARRHPAESPAAVEGPILKACDNDVMYTDLDVARWCQSHRSMLTPNQAEFIDTICLTLRSRPLTDRQNDWFEGIVRKLNRRLFPEGGDAA